MQTDPAPFKDEDFFKNVVQVRGNAGDVMLYSGLLRHCSMPNKTETGSRTAILIQLLPPYVIPMEDWKWGLKRDKVETFPDNVKRMLNLDHEYPARLDKRDRKLAK